MYYKNINCLCRLSRGLASMLLMKSISSVGGAKSLVSCFTHCCIPPVWTTRCSNQLEITDEKKDKPQEFFSKQSQQGPLESARIFRKEAKNKAIGRSATRCARCPKTRSTAGLQLSRRLRCPKSLSTRAFSLLTGAWVGLPRGSCRESPAGLRNRLARIKLSRNVL